MSGIIAWFAKNHVAANLLMISIAAAGLFSLFARTPIEVFPSTDQDIIAITVPFPGATPTEVEQGVTIRLEEAVQSLTGIDRLSSTSSEGSASVRIEVIKGFDVRDLLDDVKNRIDSLSSLPEESEIPRIARAQYKREVISVAIYGHTDEKILRSIGERVRDEIVAMEGITQVGLEAVRPYELAIEISKDTLRTYNLTLNDIAKRINANSLDLSAGNIRTDSGELLIRTMGQAYDVSAFSDISIFNRDSGEQLRLGDIATFKDGFNELPIKTRFNGEPGLLLEIYRVGDQSAIEIASNVKHYIDAIDWLPSGIQIKYWRDRSEIVKARLSTLSTSALQGGILVVLLLSLFLRPVVAFWVCLGIPVAFMGAFIVMPLLGVTLNVVSLFAFIVVLGIVVDDAIVTGENIYTHLQRGSDPLLAAVQGTKEVAVPVTFGVLTTVAAFTPIAMFEGPRGAIFAQIPMVIIPVLLFSLVESKLVLPAHLKHVKNIDSQSNANWFANLQQKISRGLEQGIIRFYGPLLKWCTVNKLLTISFFLGISIIIFSLVIGGWMRFTFFPRVQSETARAILTMPAGTSFQVTDRYIERITDSARKLKKKHIDEKSGESVIRNIYSTTGSFGGYAVGRSNIGRVVFEITPPENRTAPISSSELVKQWRSLIGPVPAAQSLTYRAEIARRGDPIDVQITGKNLKQLSDIANEVRLHLPTYSGLFDIEDSLTNGKEEIQIQLKKEAELLGVSVSDLGRQIRQAFYGYDVQRIQRDRDEVQVVLRYPLAQRKSLDDLRTMLILTPEGQSVPFNEVALLSHGQSPSQIKRVDRQRTVHITADANKKITDIEAVKRGIVKFMDTTIKKYPGLQYTLEGEAADQKKSFNTLKYGIVGVLFVIYALLAIPFASYTKPIIVMSVIPFGIVGAIIGHWIMGMNLTIISTLGMLALSGVVVNDSLVLVDYINKKRREGMKLHQAVYVAGIARFRAVILTSLTTFIGLMPLLFEKSTQAQFLIPMAVSLGFGILFATTITLLIVPINYLIYEQIKGYILSFIKTPSRTPAPKS